MTKELSALKQVLKINLLNAMELRAAFFMQVIGMMLNNLVFVFTWIFFFKSFGSINNWSINETIGLQGYVALSFGLAFSFFGGATALPALINNGSFDSLLISPRSLYLRIITSDFRISAIGDILYGVILLVIYSLIAGISFKQTVFLLALIPASFLVFLNAVFVTSLVGFLLPDAKELARSLMSLFIDPGIFPSSLYTGMLRFTFLFVIPSLAIGGLPVETIRDTSWTGLGIVWFLAILWTFLAIWLLGLAVKKYESGNLTGARV